MTWRRPERDMADMGRLLTEQRNPRSADLDRLSPLELVDLINSEDTTVPAAVSREREAIAAAVKLVAGRLGRGGRLIYVGAGTSGRLGVLDAAECPPTFGTDPEQVQGVIAGGYDALVRAQEGAEDEEEGGARDLGERGVTEDDVVLGIATSGVTPYVHGALTAARESGAGTIFLSCSPIEPDAVSVDVVINPLTGPEVVTGSTRMKAGTATKLVLNTITTSTWVLLGKTFGNLMVDLTATCDKLRDRSCRILVETAGVSYNEAAEIMERAGGHVKLAIVMARTGRDRASAERLLEENGGHVREALAAAGVDADPGGPGGSGS